MKLIIVLSLLTLGSCDYPGAEPQAPPNTYGPPAAEPVEADAAPSSASIDPKRNLFNFPSFYKGDFPPARFPAYNFLSQPFYSSQYTLRYPQRPLIRTPTTLSAGPPGGFPSFSESFPGISQIVPPIFGGGAKPIFPVNPTQPPSLPSQPPSFPNQFPSFPSQIFPPSFFKPNTGYLTQIPKLSLKYPTPNYFNTLSYFNKSPHTFSFPPNSFFPSAQQKQPVKTETLSTSYGPPAADPVEPAAATAAEPEGPAETSAPFEPAPVSYPYEPAQPDTPEETPHTPAQEYGPPSK